MPGEMIAGWVSSLEVDATVDLNTPWIAAVIVREISKAGAAGNERFPAGGIAVGSNITEVTAGELSVVKQIVELRADGEADALADIKALVERCVHVVGRL